MFGEALADPAITQQGEIGRFPSQRRWTASAGAGGIALENTNAFDTPTAINTETLDLPSLGSAVATLPGAVERPPQKDEPPDPTMDEIGLSTEVDTTSPGPTPEDPAYKSWQLVERALAGDQEAFGELYRAYVDTIFRFIYFRTGNRQLAEDLTADTFVRAIKRLTNQGVAWQGSDIGAWFTTIARNLVADHFKSGRYRFETTVEEPPGANRPDSTPEGRPEELVMDHLTNSVLREAIARLNPEQQQCIELRFLHGLSVAETAIAMSKNEGAVKALQYRAVRSLRTFLPDGFWELD